MHILWMILIGFIAGVIAKALMPGDSREPKGCAMTILLGIGGSLVAGLILNALGYGGGGGLIGAVLGAMLLILMFRKFWK
jgi:uncharacterized membrane protein YeaQ/YmgE (transglycosylase-associated protein family)